MRLMVYVQSFVLIVYLWELTVTSDSSTKSKTIIIQSMHRCPLQSLAIISAHPFLSVNLDVYLRTHNISRSKSFQLDKDGLNSYRSSTVKRIGLFEIIQHNG